MTDYALLISPRTQAAFYAEAEKIALEELAGLGFAPQIERIGGMVFARLIAKPSMVQDLLRLSCAQGLFEVTEGSMTPVAQDAGFALHPDFIWGEKYKGKTNETLTQLLISLALQTADPSEAPSLLDPMCGRGTTLFWAMRYGIKATGVEQDKSVHSNLTRALKKWTKLHRQKHKITEGWTQKANKKGAGKYLDFSAEGTSIRVITGNTVDAHDLTQRRPFDYIVSDLPYGVEHRGPGTRSPLETIEAAAPGWAKALKRGGAMVLAYNAYIPKRRDLKAVFDGLGLEVVERDLTHRMSESILRDVLILQKP